MPVCSRESLRYNKIGIFAVTTTTWVVVSRACLCVTKILMFFFFEFCFSEPRENA